MSFKDDILNDLDNVFFNELEFATEHEFDGKPIICVVDDDLLQEKKLKSATGTYSGVKTIHVSTNQLEGKPVVGSRFSFDSLKYYIKECIESDGLYTITLSANKEQ